MIRTIKVAAAQYPIDEITSIGAFEDKIAQWVREGAAGGAELLVFPEYAGMELTRIAGREIARDLHASIEALQFYLGDYDRAYRDLAKRFGVFILAGSAPVRLTDGRYVNRAQLYTPRGESGFQQKHVMTRFESEQWGISPSSGLCVFDIGVTKLGVAICYDSEFPLIARAIAEAGAEILLAPSCTDTLAGYYRVRHSCSARALENQMYVIHAPTVGDAPWSVAVDKNVGAAGFFAPSDRGFPPDGVLALGDLNEAQWVYATLDLDHLAEVRRDGEVLNSRNWRLQPGAGPLPAARVVELR